MQVRELGEQGLLKLVQQFCPREIIGDDAAILTPNPNQNLVITTDLLVDGVHFSDQTTSATDVGWRATAANLSDLAAMGATPLGITVALGLPGEIEVDWVEELYRGMSACLGQFQTPILGGDLCRSAVRTVAITALGQVEPRQVIQRSTCKPGDRFIVTGYHGSSRAGLELLLNPEQRQTLHPDTCDRLIQAHQRPQPRLDVLPLLQELFTAEPNLTIAGMDSSDGLADAILQLCRASGVGARIIQGQIPIAHTLQQFVGPEQALNWALYGGEDFELVLCLPAESAQPLVQSLGSNSAIIGIATQDPRVLLVNHLESQRANVERELSLEAGFQHF
ncbi:MAG: thiamine-phosphate kinase [Microcoleaceae cyanobacterium]